MQTKTMPDLFTQEKAAWIRSAQQKAVELLKSRPSVTIEDILAVCPRPDYIHRNTTGKVFQNEVFRHLGYVKAKKPASKGHIISTWGLNEALFVASELNQPERVYDSD